MSLEDEKKTTEMLFSGIQTTIPSYGAITPKPNQPFAKAESSKMSLVEEELMNFQSIKF
jgi:hypothetical protein